MKYIPDQFFVNDEFISMIKLTFSFKIVTEKIALTKLEYISFLS